MLGVLKSILPTFSIEPVKKTLKSVLGQDSNESHPNYEFIH